MCMKRIIICLLITLAIFSQIFAQTKRKTTRKVPRKPLVIVGTANSNLIETPTLAPETQRRLDTFRVVWQTIKDNYFDQTFNGHNWETVKTEFEPRVTKSVSDKGTYEIIEEMGDAFIE